jgi:hypothetical protein
MVIGSRAAHVDRHKEKAGRPNPAAPLWYYPLCWCYQVLLTQAVLEPEFWQLRVTVPFAARMML